jgi:CMP-N-acetylneuraminic acid synthetase
MTGARPGSGTTPGGSTGDGARFPDRLLAVIPARGGSKRVPKKNIRPLAGRPLIAYTIAAALESGLFETVMVSTDSDEIAEIARSCGAAVPFMRGAAIADDSVPVSAATVDALQRLDAEGTLFASVCQLMPNCPLRTSEDVVASYEQFAATGAESQLSVTRFGWQNPWWAMKREPGFALTPLFPEALKERSQDLPDLFCPTGAVWWAKAAVLRREGTYHIATRTGWEIPWMRAVDIDNEDDWVAAELLLQMASPGLGDR